MLCCYSSVSWLWHIMTLSINSCMHRTWAAERSRVKVKASAARGILCVTLPVRRSSNSAATLWACPLIPTSALCWVNCLWSSALMSATWTLVSSQTVPVTLLSCVLAFSLKGGWYTKRKEPLLMRLLTGRAAFLLVSVKYGNSVEFSLRCLRSNLLGCESLLLFHIWFAPSARTCRGYRVDFDVMPRKKRQAVLWSLLLSPDIEEVACSCLLSWFYVEPFF